MLGACRTAPLVMDQGRAGSRMAHGDGRRLLVLHQRLSDDAHMYDTWRANSTKIRMHARTQHGVQQHASVARCTPCHPIPPGVKTGLLTNHPWSRPTRRYKLLSMLLCTFSTYSRPSPARVVHSGCQPAPALRAIACKAQSHCVAWHAVLRTVGALCRTCVRGVGGEGGTKREPGGPSGAGRAGMIGADAV